jgi:putative transposase
VLVHLLSATRVNGDGHREVLGVEVTSAEDGAGCLRFFRDPVAHGLSGVPGYLRCPHRAGRGPRCGIARYLVATLSHPLRREPDGRHTQAPLRLGEALLHSVYDQPDAASVHAQFDRIGDALADKLPAVAEHLETACSDIIGLHRLPQGTVAADLI